MNQVICYLIICLLLIIIYYDQIQIKCMHTVRHIIKKYPVWPFFQLYDKSQPTKLQLDNLVNIDNLPILDSYDIIPNNLIQTYYDKKKIPQYIFDNVQLYANNYKYILLDDNDAILFLTKYFNIKIVQRFNDLKLGAHKADLLRYCYLYVYGGIYLDIKTILIKHLDDIFTNKTYFYTCLIDFNTVIYNGLVACCPRNPLMLSLILYIINIPLYIVNEPTKFVGYLTFCLDFYKKIQKDLNTKKKLIDGLLHGKTQSYYLFKEVSTFTLNSTCTKFDRYGGCNSIYDKNEKIFIGRDPNFPW